MEEDRPNSVQVLALPQSVEVIDLSATKQFDSIAEDGNENLRNTQDNSSTKNASRSNLLNQDYNETVNVSQESVHKLLITQPNVNTLPNGIQGQVEGNNNLDNDSGPQDLDQGNLIGEDNNNITGNYTREHIPIVAQGTENRGVLLQIHHPKMPQGTTN